LSGHIVAMNKNGQCVMEVDDISEIFGKNLATLWPSENYDHIASALVSAIAGGAGHFAGFCPTTKGRPKWWDVIVTSVPGPDGTAQNLLAVSRDITEVHVAYAEKERLFQELQVANQQMRDIFQQAPAFMCVLVGEEHVFEMINDRYFELVGNRPALGMPIRQALPELEGQGFYELLDSVYQTGEPYFGVDTPIMLQRTPGGPAEKRYMDFVYMPLRGIGGTVTGILVHGFDQTERKLAELALGASQRRLQNLISQAATGVVETNREGLITLANQKYCEMLGCTEQELLGLSLTDVTAAEFIPATVATFKKVASQGGQVVIEKQYRKRDGSHIWATSSVSALFDEANDFQGVVAIVVDITEHKTNEDELRVAGRRKDEFLAMLAHELRNPLAPISAAATLLRVAKLDGSGVRRTSEVIGRQVQHMTNLIDDLLDVSRVTRGLINLEKSPHDINRIVTDAIEQVTPLVRARHHRLSLHLCPESAIVDSDKNRIVQVIANLLNNAAKYTPEGGNILMRTEVQSSTVLIEISDNGVGMPPELTARVFDMFVQAERTIDRSSGGLGIGLSLVKSLVELHDGKVQCYSDGLGKGSKFSVHLPRIQGAEILNNGQYLGHEPKNSARGLRIMVVDDNVDAATMMSMLLQASGHEVIVEHGPRRALERSRSENIDVFILDIGLPEIDGNELAQRLRNQGETSNAMLIAVTGYGQDSDRQATAAAGFNHHLVKPVDPGKLESLLDAVSVSA
jgi:PAS domain S-box-containing protein